MALSPYMNADLILMKWIKKERKKYFIQLIGIRSILGEIQLLQIAK